MQYSSVSADGTGAVSVAVTTFRFITPVSTGNTTIDSAQPSANCIFGAANNLPDIGLIGATAPISFTTQPPTNTFTIKGSVTGPDAQAVANAKAWACTPSDTWCVGSLKTVTDASGSYELDSTINPRVSYQIWFGPPAGTDLVYEWFNNQTAPKRPRESSPSRKRSITRSSSPMPNSPPVRDYAGTVTNSSSAGVSGVFVSAYGPRRHLGRFVRHEDHGDSSYQIDSAIGGLQSPLHASEWIWPHVPVVRQRNDPRLGGTRSPSPQARPPRASTPNSTPVPKPRDSAFRIGERTQIPRSGAVMRTTGRTQNDERASPRKTRVSISRQPGVTDRRDRGGSRPSHCGTSGMRR